MWLKFFCFELFYFYYFLHSKDKDFENPFFFTFKEAVVVKIVLKSLKCLYIFPYIKHIKKYSYKLFCGVKSLVSQGRTIVLQEKHLFWSKNNYLLKLIISSCNE